MLGENETSEDAAKAQVILEHAAQRLAGHSEFLASVLNEYARHEAKSPSQLMRELGGEPRNFARLSLCRIPDIKAADFGQRVAHIAAHAQVSSVRLANLLRQAEHLCALPKGSAEPSAMLLAARDREDTVEITIDSPDSPHNEKKK